MPAAARDACTGGLNTVGVVCAVFAAGTALIAVTALRRVGAGGRSDAAAQPLDPAEGTLSGS
ncbi:hypothetical protein [Streptosporangium sp. NPDC003464]